MGACGSAGTTAFGITTTGSDGSTTRINAGTTTISSGSGGATTYITSGTTRIVTSGSTSTINNGPGVQSACIVGQKGCFCDTTGACQSGLTCTPQSGTAPVCCSGSDCSLNGGSGGSSGTVGLGGVASCSNGPAPTCGAAGITIPGAAGTGLDNCGYCPFPESNQLCAINATGGGSNPAQIQIFFTDENGITLGCADSNYPVTPLPSNPGSAIFPQTGDPACKVPNSGSGSSSCGAAPNGPLRPALYITDITNNAGCKAGDQQNGGTPYDLEAIFGTWKAADSAGVPGANATGGMNGWNLGPGADDTTQAATNCGQCATGTGMMARGGGCPGGGYSAELRFEAGLIPGHMYRLQVQVHDGDQNKGGDGAEACAIMCAPGSAPPEDGGPPQQDASYPTPPPDGGITTSCGGTISCSVTNPCPGGGVCVLGCCD